jgi:transposase-like protein
VIQRHFRRLRRRFRLESPRICESQANVSQACKSVKIVRETFYSWLRQDPAFREAYEASREQAIEVLEDEAVRRAKIGSDTLLIFLLKGARPQKYRDNVHLEGSLAVGAIEQAIARGKERSGK